MAIASRLSSANVAELGRQIAAGRKAAGLDQDELATMVGCRREVLSDWELGKVTRFQKAILLGIVRALGRDGEAVATEAVRLRILTADAVRPPKLGWTGEPPALQNPQLQDPSALSMLAPSVIVRSDEATRALLTESGLGEVPGMVAREVAHAIAVTISARTAVRWGLRGLA
jgi:transcriptional regulator with XRE-family HTH domain